MGAMGSEWLMGTDRKGLGSLRDNSALLTGILLGLTLPPSIPLWMAFLGGVIAGAVAIGLLRTYNRSRLESASLGRFDALVDLEVEFDVDIVVLDTQRVRALAHRGTVYLSVGLLERLDDDQLRAVIAHEVYHLVTRSPRMLSSFLSLTSLTFLRYSEEREADAYAARIIGEEALVGALETLEIRDRKKRAANLRNRA